MTCWYLDCVLDRIDAGLWAGSRNPFKFQWSEFIIFRFWYSVFELQVQEMIQNQIWVGLWGLKHECSNSCRGKARRHWGGEEFLSLARSWSVTALLCSFRIHSDEQVNNPLRWTRGHDFTFPLALVLKRKAVSLFNFPCRITLVGRALTFTWRVYETKGATFICIFFEGHDASQSTEDCWIWFLKIKAVCICEQVPLSSSSSRRTRWTTALPPLTRAAIPLCQRYTAGVRLTGNREASVLFLLLFSCAIRIQSKERRSWARRRRPGGGQSGAKPKRRWALRDTLQE